MEQARGNRSRRGVAFIAVVAVSVVAFASLGGVGLAQSAISLAQYQYGKQSQPGKHTIRISTRAWPAHKRHGDVVGTCAEAKKRAAKAHAKKAHAKADGKKGKSGGEHGKKADDSTLVAPSTEPTSGKSNGKGKGADKGQSGQGSGKDHGGNHDD